MNEQDIQEILKRLGTGAKKKGKKPDYKGYLELNDMKIPIALWKQKTDCDNPTY